MLLLAIDDLCHHYVWFLVQYNGIQADELGSRAMFSC